MKPKVSYNNGMADDPNRTARSRAITAGVLFLLVVAVMLPYAAVLWSRSWIFLFRDLTNVLLPAKAVWVRGVLELGRIPLWDPFSGGGRPFLPDLNGSPLYPLNWMLLPFGADGVARGLVFFVVAHHALMALAMFALLRELRCRHAIAATGALALAAGGFAVSADNLLPDLCGLTAIPAYFFFLLRARRGETLLPVPLAGASLALAWIMYGGSPETAYVAALLTPFVLWKKSVPRALVQSGSVGALAALAAGPQLFPTLAYLSRALREYEHVPENLRYAFQTAWSLHPRRLFELVFPYAFFPGRVAPGWAWNTLNVENQASPFIFSNFAGSVLAAPVLLALPGWARGFRHRRPRRWMLALAALTLTLLAMGAFSPVPLYRLALAVLPVWRRFRYPERLVCWVCFAWIIFGALSAERVFRLQRRPPILIAATLFSVLSLVFLLAGGSAVSFAHAAVFFLLALGAFRAGARGVTWAPAALPVLLLLDIFQPARALIWPQPAFLIARGNLPTVEKVLTDRDRNQAVSAGGAQRLYVLDEVNGPPLVPGNPEEERNQEAASKWAHLLFNTSAYWGIENVRGYFALDVSPSLLDKIPDSQLRRRLLDVMSVRYLVDVTLQGDQVSASRSALPFASFPRHIEWLADESAVLRRIQDPGWDEQHSALLTGPAATQAPDIGAPGVLHVEKRFDEMDFRLKMGTSGAWLLVNEYFSENWAAQTSSGETMRIVPANGWAMALFVPPAKAGGEVDVRMNYFEPSYELGCRALLVWVLAVVGWVVVEVKRRRSLNRG